MLTLIKEWEFDEDLAADLERSSAAVLLNHARALLQLRKVEGLYDPGIAHTARTPYLSGTRWTALLGFDEELAEDLPAGTALDYRLGNGAAEFWWTGTAWAAAALSTDWSPAADVRAHLSTFPLLAANPRLRVTVRLRADSAGADTPRLRALRVAVRVDVEQLEDLFVDGLHAYLTQIRGLADYTLKSSGTVAEAFKVAGVLVADLRAYDVSDVVSVYDTTADPGRLVNLLGSYNATSGALTLTAAPVLGHQLAVRYEYRPRVYKATGSDLPAAELLGKVPALEIEDIRAMDGGSQMPGRGAYVRDPEAGTYLLVPPPRRDDYRIILNIHTAGNRELPVLGNRLISLFEEQPTVTAPGTGERYSVRLTRAPDTIPRRGSSEVRSSRLEFQLDRVQVYSRPAESGRLVSQLVPAATAAGTTS